VNTPRQIRPALRAYGVGGPGRHDPRVPRAGIDLSIIPANRWAVAA
jgi:hypothetical protein